MSLLLKADYGIYENKKIYNCNILIEQGKIISIGGESAFKETTAKKVLKFNNCYICPSFIDQNISGFKKQSCDNISDLPIISQELVKHGVNSFLASIHSKKIEDELQFLNDIQSYKNKKDSADLIGVHMIGPFINRQRSGANNINYIRPSIDLGEAKEILNVANGKIKIMTFSPELPHSTKLAELLLENNVIPSMGYSNAQEKEVIKLINLGVENCTHLYNAMSPIHQRKEGLATTVLITKKIKAEVIFDGYHVHPHMLKLACLVKDYKKIIAVSNTSQGAGLPDGKYCFGDKKVLVKDHHIYDEKEERILGSFSPLDLAWQYTQNNCKLDIKKTIAYFTSNPAEDLKLYNQGLLIPGMAANLNIFNEEHKLIMSIKEGSIVFKQ